MSIEKKSLISNRAATKKANLTKVNAATQVSATKLGKPLVSPAAASKVAGKVLVSPAAASKLAGKVLVSPAACSKVATTMIRMKVRVS